MNIIIIAYSCSPSNGSEDKFGWFIPYELSLKNKIWLITKPDSKNEIERFMAQNHSNINIIYCDIPNYYKKIYKKGPLYSGRLNIWNKRVIKIVDNICQQNSIDIIHQLNPVEFRSIGDYGKFGVPFVCGPVGGGEYIPRKALQYALDGLGIEVIRCIANCYYKYKYKITGRLKRVNYLLFANNETRDYLIASNKRNLYSVMTELVAIIENQNFDIKNESAHLDFTILAAGRLIYRKGFVLLLESLKLIPEKYNIKCIIVGDGPQKRKLKKMVENNTLLKQRVNFIGKVPHSQMIKYYQISDFFVMPSLRETTGTVLLEALENGVPVITVNKFGAKNILNQDTSVLYDYEDDQPVNALAEAILYAYNTKNQFDCNEIKKRASDFSCKKKSAKFLDIYNTLVQYDK